ncbi:MAG: galactose-1-phosphate uridylyltransferase [Methanoregulaceae archaeon]|nr:galactose-1-phosphate uridylyltransferase [Methanoregulaceae archaeon]
MFTVREIPAGKGILQYREETLTGLRCRISPERLSRHIDNSFSLPDEQADCPFCPASLPLVTPLFTDGTRIHIGESVTFPNLFPFAAFHTVTVITRAHAPAQFTASQLRDAFLGQIQSLRHSDGFTSINWNYLPSSGASLQHPHLQGLADKRPGAIAERYIIASEQYLVRNGCSYWEVLREQEAQEERYLFGDEIVWAAQGVPLGEREVRGYLPVTDPVSMESYIDPLVSGILRVIGLYRQLGTYAFNMSIIFERPGRNRGFSAFCSLISRINPNRSSLSDSSFMERLHLEPVILTLPEELGRFSREEAITP